MAAKILHLGVLSQPGNFHCEKWSRALARAGAKVTIFTLDDQGLVTADATDGVEVVNLPPPVRWGGRYRYPSYFLTAKALRKALQRRKVEVLHPLHLTPFGTWALLSGFRPVIAAAMGADVLEYPPDLPHLKGSLRTWRTPEVQQSPVARLQERLRNRFYRARVQQVIRRSALVTGDNQPLVDALISWFGADPARTRLLRWGLEPEKLTFTEADRALVRQQWGIPAEARVVFSPRGANALYQTDILLEAIARLLPQPSFADYFFLVLGAGYPAAPSVVRQADRLSQAYPTRFRFVPQQIPRAEVYRLWSVVDVFLSTPIYDGYSAAIAEGRYVGAIPVVNAIPGNREVVQDGYNGILIPEPFGAETTVEALQRVNARFSEFKSTFAPRNRAWIEQYSVLDRNAATWLHWAEKVLQKS